jgi:hypothetical protein
VASSKFRPICIVRLWSIAVSLVVGRNVSPRDRPFDRRPLEERLMDRERALVASALATSAGGAMDAWVYSAHGHVFANAQSGNIVLMGVALAGGDVARATTHLPSLLSRFRLVDQRLRV